MVNGCSVASPTLVYVWPTKEEFDLIDQQETLHAWVPDNVGTVLANDGRAWERRCHSKVFDGSGVTVVFQFFDERPICDSEE